MKKSSRTPKLLPVALAVSAILVFSSQVLAQDKKEDGLSPVGVWRSVDDATGKPKSLVQIWEQGNKLYGKVVELIDPPEPNPLCDKCEGTEKNKPVIGMTVIRGLKKDGDEWSGGKILDPESGSTYKCYIEVQEGGKKLKVRGFIGISLLGRTQYWHRVR
ncbi:MAG: DUF2147 domain-containing protein [Myxococcota bacterium]|jgi:uncharacterized protein (DUF2147 family)|nr:DUF2147 domain-containing protein [Myxococcota bacterium]